jgi:hypothetical protein
MKLTKSGAEKIAALQVTLDDDAENAKAALIEAAGERAWFSSNEWSARERAIYNLAWEQAKAVGVEYAVRELFSSEGVAACCDAYDVLTAR